VGPQTDTPQGEESAKQPICILHKTASVMSPTAPRFPSQRDRSAMRSWR